MNKSGNNFLNNAATHCEGLIVGKLSSPTVKITNYCTANDPDGNMLIWGTPETGGLAGQNFLDGTGKYKGIKGSAKAKITANAKNP